MCQSCLHFLRAPDKWHFYEILSQRSRVSCFHGLCLCSPDSISRSPLCSQGAPSQALSQGDLGAFAGKQLFLATLPPPRRCVCSAGDSQAGLRAASCAWAPGVENQVLSVTAQGCLTCGAFFFFFLQNNLSKIMKW